MNFPYFNVLKRSNLSTDLIGREVFSKLDLTQRTRSTQQVYHTYSFASDRDFVFFLGDYEFLIDKLCTELIYMAEKNNRMCLWKQWNK